MRSTHVIRARPSFFEDPFDKNVPRNMPDKSSNLSGMFLGTFDPFDIDGSSKNEGLARITCVERIAYKKAT